MFNIYSQVGNYINGKLSSEERETFEAHLKTDRDLQKMVEEYDIYSALAEGINDERIREKIEEIRNEKKEFRIGKESSSYSKVLNWMGLLIIGMLLIGLFKFLKPSDSDQYALIFDNYYSPPMGTDIRGGEINSSAKILRCDQGHVLLDEMKHQEALVLFEQSLKANESGCKERAEFYIALIRLKEGDLDSSITLFNTMANNPAHTYQRKASEILKQIN